MRVLVVGGGVIGLGIAWRAAERGLDVCLVDPEPGRGASGVAAGMLAPVTEVHYGEEDLLALNLESARRYPTFVADVEAASGIDTGYRATGTVAVARDADDLAALEELVAYQRSLGLDVERLRSRELRRLEPGLAPGVRGGAVVTGDHQVDPRRLVASLLAACRGAGVTWCRELARRIDGPSVALAGGGSVEHGDVVVLAAGAWSGRIEGLPGELKPAVRPVKGQILRLQGRRSPPISRNVRGAEAYLVPRRDGEVVVGATVEERGFDATVTGGAVHDLLRAAIELVPDVAELALAETAAGLRPGTPDNAPMIGPTSSEGLIAATGHYRNGILLAPVTADAVAELLATGVSPAEIAAFSPRRFERVRS